MPTPKQGIIDQRVYTHRDIYIYVITYACIYVGFRTLTCLYTYESVNDLLSKFNYRYSYVCMNRKSEKSIKLTSKQTDKQPNNHSNQSTKPSNTHHTESADVNVHTLRLYGTCNLAAFPALSYSSCMFMCMNTRNVRDASIEPEQSDPWCGHDPPRKETA